MLIVIDGTDGSGKETQSKRLLQHLEEEGFPATYADFPQHGQKSAGMVDNYLNGKYGTSNEVDPKIASVFYALDRYDASFAIRKNLDGGKIVVCNRYVPSNMGHQGGKIGDEGIAHTQGEALALASGMPLGTIPPLTSAVAGNEKKRVLV